MSEKPKAPAIPITPVESSSNVSGWGYDAATSTLAVRFKGGATYHYAGVPRVVVDELHEAKSVGSFIASKIVGAGFAATKIALLKAD